MSSDSENESTELNESLTESDSQLEDENESSTEDAEEDMNEENASNSDEEVDGDIEESKEISDNEESEDDQESENNSKNIAVKSAEDIIREKIINRLKPHLGKQLYVRFNARLPENEDEFQKLAKALSPLITKANKPRQKHARFCLVDFETQKDRDEAFVQLRAASNKKDPALKGIVVSIPRTESEEFVEELIQRKIKTRESKIAKARLKRAIKQAKKRETKTFTSTVLVRHLPGNVSKAEIRGLFANAVDIQMKPFNKSSVATVTFPTSKDAREAVKQNFSLGGTRLKITFHGRKVQTSNGETEKRKPGKDKKFKKKSETEI